jgi:hypothetical protein
MQAELDSLFERQNKVASVHKAFAFVTAGALLAADALGAYHFRSLMSDGHDYCETVSGRTDEDKIDPSVYKEGIQQAWRSTDSQLFRVLHGSTVALGSISYTATATMELTMPRMSEDNRPISSVNIHRYLFYFHAGLMLANIGLGFLESHALSQGNHDLVRGAGIAHMVVGFALPVVITTSGIVYKLPL